MKISLQDLTIFIAGFVALLSAYTVGSTCALGVLVGWELAILVVPPNIYEMATVAIRVLLLPTGAFLGAVLLLRFGRLLSPKAARLIFCTAILISLFILGQSSDKWFTSELTDIMIVVITALIVSLVILEGENLNLSVILLAGLTIPFLAKGYMDQSRAFHHVMEYPGRYHVVTTEKAYVYTRLLRSTSAGVLIASGREFIFYPMDKIVSVSKDQQP